MIQHCPSDNHDDSTQVHYFTKGFIGETKSLLDAAERETMMN